MEQDPAPTQFNLVLNWLEDVAAKGWAEVALSGGTSAITELEL